MNQKKTSTDQLKNHRPILQTFDIPTFENLDKMEKIYTLPKIIRKKIQLRN